MSLDDKMLRAGEPLVLFEMVPPPAGKPGAEEALIKEAAKVTRLVDAINLPEIHDEARNDARKTNFIERIEPRRLGARIRRELGIDAIINRCVVYDADPVPWFRETRDRYELGHVVIVGGESSRVQYPGPGVTAAAAAVARAGVGAVLGGISIPSRVHESDRVRRKAEAGLTFFTTQVLFDSNDIVWLLQRLNGLDARVFLSFAPVSHPRDIEFLRWLGADIPADLDRYLLGNHSSGAENQSSVFLERSLDLSRRILMDVFDNLPPDPPLIGLNVEHINKRNFGAAVTMLEKLGSLYRDLVAARA